VPGVAFQIWNERVINGTCSTLQISVKLLPRDACFDVLSLGDFSLHEQREVTRSPDASGNAQDASTILRSG
jgi:hypothetical protein